ncbi:hypothetical protein KFL_000370340 [Klebsormidium nitens]|uniref:Uncharacterized protein n=1 Tax=Klebsormidium nitens TaxID=105231 RepID=A0A1Y1HMC0_KLENI|nr:hypothetical protein KFL_000370340 [Klebsormidium nitens]|eukprot:GAQ79760.1 hypothetical protein KFL_000370340 [Klebsormidium nitens]
MDDGDSLAACPPAIQNPAFRLQGLTDNTLGGLNGVLLSADGTAATVAGAGRWLSDLPFVQPTYPWLETTAVCTDPGEEEGRPAVYELTVKAIAANGDPLVGYPLHWWYVKHLGTSDAVPVRVTTDTGGGPVSVTAIQEGTWQDDGTPPEGTVWPVTDSKGRVVFTVEVPKMGYGPSFDFRMPGFMTDPHERFHANVLNNVQKLKRPPPPQLLVQCELQEDYSYGEGPDARIDETRSKPVYMVHVRAQEANGGFRAREQFRIYASDQTTVVYKNKEYPISSDVALAAVSDNKGDVMLHIVAGAATAPQLAVWAGFMHRSERQLISPDVSAHARLAKVTGTQLTDPKRAPPWSPAYQKQKDAGTPPTNRLLNKDVPQSTADQAAQAMCHVMAAVHPPPALPKAPRKRLRANSGGPPNADPHAPTAQSARLSIPLDEVPARPTTVHLQSRRRAAISVEGLAASLDGYKGFSLQFLEGNQVKLTLHKTGEDVRARTEKLAAQCARRGPDAAARVLKGFFSWVSDAWNAVKEAAEAAARLAEEAVEKAREIVVAIENEVTVFVQTAESLARIVVDSVEKAVGTVVDFVRKIGVLIEQFVQFLMLLFDWGDILAAKARMRELLGGCASALAGMLAPANLAGVVKLCEGEILKLSPGPSSAALPAPSNNLLDNDFGQKACGQASSSRVKTMQNRATNQIPPAGAQTPGPIPIVPPGGSEPAHSKLATALLGTLSDLDDLLSGDVLAAVPLILDLPKLLDDLFPLEASEVTDIVTGALRAGGDALKSNPFLDLVDAVFGAMDAGIDIPFVSMLYKWITGHELTVLDLLCLLLGLAAHIAYAWASELLTGHGASFADDAAGLAQYFGDTLRNGMALALGGSHVAKQERLTDVPKTPILISYCVLKGAHIFTNLATMLVLDATRTTVGKDLDGCWQWPLVGTDALLELGAQTVMLIYKFQEAIDTPSGTDKAVAAISCLTGIIMAIRTFGGLADAYTIERTKKLPTGGWTDPVLIAVDKLLGGLSGPNFNALMACLVGLLFADVGMIIFDFAKGEWKQHVSSLGTLVGVVHTVYQHRLNGQVLLRALSAEGAEVPSKQKEIYASAVVEAVSMALNVVSLAE